MKEEIVTFDTAALAKEKGFNIETQHQWTALDGSNSGFSLPSQSLLQKWLREIHGIYAVASPAADNKWKSCTYKIDMESIMDQMQRGRVIAIESTYETALEAALQTALKLIV